MLIRVHKRCKDFKISLRLCNIDKEIEKVFKITGLNKILKISSGPPDDPPDEDGVFAKLKRPPSGGMAARDFDADGE